jgi:hypothetical protein
MEIEKLKNLIQSCNINFIIGSGLSRPYLSTLNNIEILLTELANNKEINNPIRQIIQASLYKKYFLEVMLPNLDSEIETNKTEDFSDVLNNYKEFLLAINEILLNRYCRLHNKQVNIFTTNIDLFFERAIEETKVEFNDGFKGRMNPVYDLSNFLKSYSKTSLHYENTSEIPVFNLLKIHGSISWCSKDGGKTINHSNFDEILEVKKYLIEIADKALLDITSKHSLEELIKSANEINKKEQVDLSKFLNSYNKLLIVNPTKEKFQKTLFDQYYYELMRMYANMLEKENSLLFAMGFSFADEHVKEITIRAANSNPTMQIIVFSHTDDEKSKIESEIGIDKFLIKNSNISVVSPTHFINENAKYDDEKRKEMQERIKYFNFKTINNEVFNVIKKNVSIAR